MRVNWQFIKAIPEPRLLHKGRNVLSLKKSTCDRNEAVNNEPHSEQLSRRTNNIGPINQEALSS